ncbi:MAG TPA: lipoprotein [Steroidobacteraceae bacterium]|jgi:predicted small lipoprotein YifL|nr:lipoprotein [Steroidobacteraceae bacterium]
MSPGGRPAHYTGLRPRGARAALGVAAAFMTLLSGCGQKGPLYLPDKNAAVVTAPAQPATTTPPTTTPPATTPATPKKPDQDDSPSPQ